MSLGARDVRWSAGGQVVVDHVSVDVAPGSTLGLLGPNGSGKSSLLRLLAGLRRPDGGAVLLDGRPLEDLRRRDVARRVAVVDQHADTDVDVRVVDVVRLGRIPHRSSWAPDRSADDLAVADALAMTGLHDRAEQPWRTLSGGERQRVQIARALAQRPRELLLDEPTNHLDVHHQLDLLNLVCDLPVTSVLSLHDLDLAAGFCDAVVVLDAGRAVAAGPPVDVLTPALIEAVFHVRAVVARDEDDGRPTVRFRRSRPARSLVP